MTHPTAALVTSPIRVGKKYFSLAEANRALPYVGRIVRDLTACYGQVLDIRHDIENPQTDQRPDQLEADYEHAMERLGQYVDELNVVGVELKDFEKGLLDFPAMHQGRPIMLCWQLGEERIVAWHDVDAGYQGRQDVKLLASAADPA